ncbi:MAG: hypothetical protein JRG76_04140 [Deltaproteobacteria bacterium]|nr:hypothetical protein [Deltaproteobacteria bacterium]MBW2413680.1 hypothetical protein [Deltaproteobacteria bacterium]
MSDPIYSYDEMMSDDDYARPHEEAGYKLHGGFDAEGRYVSPRMKVRSPAVDEWRERMVARGGGLIDADETLLAGETFPSYPQTKLMLQSGIDQGIWNSLTITGVIEARGRALLDYPAPDLQKIIVDDISAMAAGHLAKGLLHAHGMDEGGDPASDRGAHDAMWFAVRDTVFGKGAYPLPEVPENIGRPDSDRREIPDIPAEYEQLILLMMNVLMIEIRAEMIFDYYCKLLGDPDLFSAKREAAEWGVEIVNRIRQDEAIHVGYLQLVLSELRGCTFKTTDGKQVAGSELIDPVWERMVHWHAVDNPKLQREQSRKDVEARILTHPRGDEILAEFRALED